MTAELYALTTTILENHSLSLFAKVRGCILMHLQSNLRSNFSPQNCRGVVSGWQLINYNNGTLNCPLCPTVITPQFRPERKESWDLYNLKRHLSLYHPNVARSSSSDFGINSFLEIVMGAGKILFCSKFFHSVSPDAALGDGSNDGTIQSKIVEATDQPEIVDQEPGKIFLFNFFLVQWSWNYFREKCFPKIFLAVTGVVVTQLQLCLFPYFQLNSFTPVLTKTFIYSSYCIRRCTWG